MGSDLVVFSTEVLNHHPSLGQRPESLSMEALVPEPTMEALYKAILPGTSRFYERQLYALLF